MSKLPPVPPAERRRGPGQSKLQRKASAAPEGLDDRRDARTGVETGQPGDADLNAKLQGRFGDIKQNTTHKGYQQDR